MIFDEFDKALWLIIKGDKKNKGKILEFIKSIPNEFILKIQETIKEYIQYKLENEEIPYEERKEKYFSGDIYTMEGYFYSFNIDIKNDMLFIGRSIYENGAYYNDFRISLSRMNLNVDNSFNQNIGGILSASLFEERVVVDYFLVSIGIGNLLFKSINNNVFRVCGIINKEFLDDCNLRNMESRFGRSKKRDIRRDMKNV